MTASGIALEGSSRDRRLGKMNTRDAMDNVTLDQLGRLPEVQVRPAS
jgi:hypothetical protein